MAKQKFRPTRPDGFSGAKAYLREVEVLKKRRNAVGPTFCDAIVDKRGKSRRPRVEETKKARLRDEEGARILPFEEGGLTLFGGPAVPKGSVALRHWIAPVLLFSERTY